MSTRLHLPESYPESLEVTGVGVLTPAAHIKVGVLLQGCLHLLREVRQDLWAVHLASGSVMRAFKFLERGLNGLRSDLEEDAYLDYDHEFRSEWYYGGDVDARLNYYDHLLLGLQDHDSPV